MSSWERYGMSGRVRRVLEAVPLNNPQGHHFGRPYLSSYQIAIALDAEDPRLREDLGKAVGGRGTGSHTSLAQYIGNELSKQIRAQGDQHFVEGAFMSNQRVRSVVYQGVGGNDVVSSLAGTQFDMALSRIRQ